MGGGGYSATAIVGGGVSVIVNACTTANAGGGVSLIASGGALVGAGEVLLRVWMQDRMLLRIEV